MQENGAAASPGFESESATKLVLGDISKIPFQELYSVLSARPQSELMDAARQLADLPANHENAAKITAFFKAWAQFDAKGAVAGAALLKTPQARETALGAVVEGADANAAEAVAKAINEMPADSFLPNHQRGLVGRAASKWSGVDAPAAAHFLDTVPSTPGSFFDDAHSIAQNWAASDPQAALAWAQQHDGSSAAMVHFATSGAIIGWWQKDPVGAEQYVASHLSTLADRQLAATLASQMYNSDPNRAIQWVNQLPDLEARRHGDMAVATQMAMRDGRAAAEWAANLPDDVRGSALSSTIGMWAQSDAAAAGQWVNTLNGELRDRALSGYSSVLANDNPSNALNWAGTISDPTIRTSSIDRIVRNWMQRNPADATAWVQQSALPADQKQRLLANTPPGG